MVASESRRVLLVVVSVDSVGPQALSKATIRPGKPINLTIAFMGSNSLVSTNSSRLRCHCLSLARLVAVSTGQVMGTFLTSLLLGAG